MVVVSRRRRRRMGIRRRRSAVAQRVSEGITVEATAATATDRSRRRVNELVLYW